MDQGPIAHTRPGSNNPKRLKRFIFWGLGTAALLVALVLLALPVLVDAPALRAEVQRRLSEALHGQVSWDALEIKLFPPHAELYRVRVEIPEKLSAAAEELDVSLRLWPLLRGDIQISNVSARKPAIRILAKSSASSEPIDPLKAYRAVMEPASKALQDFAADMTLRIEQGQFDQFRNINFSAQTNSTGVDLELSAASDLWKRLSVRGRVEFADLSARAQVQLDGLTVDADIPALNLRAQARTDGKTLIECDFDATAGSIGSAKGKAVLPANKLTAELNGIDVPQVMAIVARKLPGKLDAVESSEGRVNAQVEVDISPLNLNARITRSDAAIKLAALPWKISAAAGHVAVSEKSVHVTGAKGRVGDSSFEHAAAQIDLASGRLTSASANASVKFEQWIPWLKIKAPLDEVDSLTGSAEVKLNRLALRFDRPQEADYQATAVVSNTNVVLRSLPAPVAIKSGSVQADRAQVRFTSVAAALLDAQVVASGAFDLQKSTLTIGAAEGSTGQKLVRWGMARAEVPERFEPRTPLRFSAQRIAWAPQRPLEIEARLDFDGGPQVGLSLVSTKDLLDLKHVTLKDASSDAKLSARIAPKLIEASFAGTLHERTLAALRRERVQAGSGTVSGELLMSMDRAAPQNSAADGKLRIETLDLSWLAGKRAVIEHIELAADKKGVRISDARLDWDEQRFILRGNVQRGGEYPVIQASLESAGVDLKRLLPPPKPKQPGEPPAKIWPLPVRGSIEVRAGFLDYNRYRVAPFDGVLALEPQKARLEVKQAAMCGVSFPLEMQVEPEHNALDIHVAMKDQPFEKSLNCLTGGTMVITGNADLTAELHTQGQRPHLLRDMTGTAQLELRDGTVKKFAALGNILSLRNIADVKRMNQDGFPYRTMRARGRFEKGEFLLDEGAFDSSAVHLAVTGRVDMLGANSRLTVLVGLLTTIDRLAGGIPILKDVFGGSLTALPVGVSGDIRDPLVVPLGPGAVTDRLLDILGNTVKLPAKLAPGQAK